MRIALSSVLGRNCHPFYDFGFFFTNTRVPYRVGAFHVGISRPHEISAQAVPKLGGKLVSMKTARSEQLLQAMVGTAGLSANPEGSQQFAGG
jgi:hypothetical protein